MHIILQDDLALLTLAFSNTQSASDEIDAHTTMFYTTSATYYTMGLRAAALIVSCLDNEEKYGNQVQTQSDGDKEHGQSSQEAYGVDEDKETHS